MPNIRKKTIEELAKETGIDISEQAGEKVKQEYLNPRLQELKTAGEQTEADVQQGLQGLSSDYFNKYLQAQTQAQARGLTGGLANIGQNRLQMQMGEAQSGLQSQALKTRSELAAKRGSALSEAEAYKSNYLKDLQGKLLDLREKDYAQRYQEAADQEQLAAQRAAAAARASSSYGRKSTDGQSLAQAQADAEGNYRKEYTNIMISDVPEAQKKVLINALNANYNNISKAMGMPSLAEQYKSIFNPAQPQTQTQTQVPKTTPFRPLNFYDIARTAFPIPVLGANLLSKAAQSASRYIQAPKYYSDFVEQQKRANARLGGSR